MLTRNRSRTKSPPSTPPVVEEIVISYKTTIRRSDYGMDSESEWRDNIWKILLTLRNLDDEVVIVPNDSMRQSLTAFGEANMDGVNKSIHAEAIVKAMMTPAYAELSKETIG